MLLSTKPEGGISQESPPLLNGPCTRQVVHSQHSFGLMGTQLDNSKSWASSALAFAIYQALAILWFGTPVLSDFSHNCIGMQEGTDPSVPYVVSGTVALRDCPQSQLDGSAIRVVKYGRISGGMPQHQDLFLAQDLEPELTRTCRASNSRCAPSLLSANPRRAKLNVQPRSNWRRYSGIKPHSALLARFSKRRLGAA